MTQPEALRLAAALDAYWGAENGHDRERQAADELRRLHAQRDALLEALQALYDEQQAPPLIRHQAALEAAMQKARAAIKAVKEKA